MLRLATGHFQAGCLRVAQGATTFNGFGLVQGTGSYADSWHWRLLMPTRRSTLLFPGSQLPSLLLAKLHYDISA